jgi:competence protein ComEC
VAWIGVCAAVSSTVVSIFAHRAEITGIALFLFAGSLIGASSPVKPSRFGKMGAEAESPPSMLEKMHARASRSIDRVFGADAPMAKALLIADQHEIPIEMRDRYARAGMVHMLSISGLHVAIIAGAMLLLLEAMHIPRGIASVIGVALTAFYVAIIGAPPPAVRSAGMLAMVAASKLTQRPTSPWAALAVGALAPLIQPCTVLDLGYQLSVVGIAGLIASGKLARRIIPKEKPSSRKKIHKELLTSIVATIVTAPLIAWYFGRISLIAPVANLVAGPVISLLQPTLFVALAVAPLGPAAKLFADAAHPMLAAFDGIATIASSIPGASVDVVPSLTTVVAGAFAVVSFVVACVSRYFVRPAVCCIAALSAVMWSPAIRLPYRGAFEMHVLDVGQGDAILVRTDRGRWILFDAGRIWKSGDAGRSRIIPYVMSRGGTLEAFVLSHAHADHIGGAGSVIRALHPQLFWDAAFPQGSGVYASALRTADSAGTVWKRVHPSDTMRVDGVLVRFLAPDSAWTASLGDPNEASTIAVVEFGETRFLLMGDAERDEEAWLVNHAFDQLHADVLKVGHHGSSTSSTDAFLAAVHPSLAVISVGVDNMYGHPSADVLAALGRAGARTVRTDRSGTVVVRSDGHRITYEAGGETWAISRR